MTVTKNKFGCWDGNSRCGAYFQTTDEAATRGQIKAHEDECTDCKLANKKPIKVADLH